MGQYNDNLYGTAYDKKQNTNVAGLETKLNGLLTIATANPAAKPTAAGLLHFNKTSQELFISVGTSQTTDWKNVKAVAIV